MPRDQAYAGRSYPAGYLDNMRRIAQESGIDMKRPETVANTRKAHEATEFARESGLLLPFHRAVFKAYWEDGANISEAGVLCDIGRVCGLDDAALRTALEDGRYAARVQEQMDWAREAGVTGIPTFIFEGRFAVVGAQDYDLLRDVAQRVLSRPPA